MQQVIRHPWEVSISEARALQEELARKVLVHDCVRPVNVVGGVDVAYDKNSNKLIAGAVLLDAVSHQVLETAVVEDIERFPYVPGLFSFRELPPIALAIEQLKRAPDLILCDGHGIAHPRRFGIASHLGVIFDVATIGCGKTRLVGDTYVLGDQRGDSAALVDRGETVGHILRTQTGIKPVYVSIGHKISLPTASDWILKLATRYRLPETSRKADQLVRAALSSRMGSL